MPKRALTRQNEHKFPIDPHGSLLGSQIPVTEVVTNLQIPVTEVVTNLQKPCDRSCHKSSKTLLASVKRKSPDRRSERTRLSSPAQDKTRVG